MTSYIPQRMGIVQADAKRKGREFQALLLGAVYANKVWDVGDAETKRPVYATFGASEAEMPSFEANLREGRACAPAGTSGSVSSRIEFPRSAEYAWLRTRCDEGVLLTAYLPSVLRHDPGFLDGETPVRFTVLPTLEWAEAQRAALGDDDIEAAVQHIDRMFLDQIREKDEAEEREMRRVGRYVDPSAKQGRENDRRAFLAHLRAMVPTAHLFVAALDKRVRLPVVPDLSFAVQLFFKLHTTILGSGYGAPAAGSSLSAMMRDINRERTGWEEVGTESLGLAPGAWCAVGPKALGQIISAETKRYLEHRVSPRTARRAHRAA